jgi:hypothetical protein
VVLNSLTCSKEFDLVFCGQLLRAVLKKMFFAFFCNELFKFLSVGAMMHKGAT